MKKTFLKPPDVCENELEERDPALEFEPETEVRAQRLCGLWRGDATGARFSGALFQNARLSAVAMRGAHFEDTRFRACDLANLDARRVYVSRVEILECRATGLCAPESDWRDAIFRDSNLSLSQFRHAKWERARFQGCDLREADFQNADLRGVIFDGCDLRGAQMSFARLQGCDVCSSRTDDLSVNAEALRGLVVSPLQAAQLSKVLGLVVNWSARGD